MQTTTRISELLRRFGYADRADWIDVRTRTLLDPLTAASEARAACADLHGIVLGMGGLFDLDLRPMESGAPYPIDARTELNGLADNLYELTAPLD